MNGKRLSLPPSGPQRGQTGLALIAVLVSLGFLLAITLPFMLSMRHGGSRARAAVDETQVAWAADSVRDLLLQGVANSAGSIDPTPSFDGRDEFAAALELPEAFRPLSALGVDRHVLQGEVADLARFVELASATPLVYANLLQLVVRTTGETKADATELLVDGDTSTFPEQGLLYCNREVIRYGQREGNRFTQLERGVYAELGYFPSTAFPEYVIEAESAVLDLRCVLAVLLGIDLDGDPASFHALGSVGELGRLAVLGLPSFTPRQLERLERFLCGSALRESSSRFGRGERVFEILPDETQRPRLLRVKSAAAMGAGRVVRVRSLDGKLVEYALVHDTQERGERGTYELGGGDWIALVRPLTATFTPPDCVVEPLVPAAVNLNTAPVELIEALLANLRRPAQGAQRGDDHRASASPPSLSRARAKELALSIAALRGDGGEAESLAGTEFEPRPFDGWQDFGTRVVPLLSGDADAAPGAAQARRMLAMAVYDGMQLGCTKSLELGTIPIAFHSGQLVRYRASASRQRATGREVARKEIEGLAIAMPGQQLAVGAATQEQLDEAFRLDRRSPFWHTFPINTSALQPFDLNTVPAVHTSAHLLASLFPDAGFGTARWPARSGEAGSMRPQPATTPLSLPGNGVYAHDSFLTAQHPEGRDLGAEGGYRAQNSGPRAGNVQAQRSFDHSRIVFPMTSVGGVTAPFATAFWLRLDATGPQALFDLARNDGVAERNRIQCAIVDGKLRLQIVDEAGIDPNPGDSEYAPELSAGVWEVPTESLALQPGLWYHVALSAHGNRPGQLSLFIDGAPRGEPRLRTVTAQALPTYQPQSGQASFLDESERFIDLRVESTEGFPNRGVLRVGLELFEYSAKDSTSFRGRFDDSAGGRRARAAMHEFAVEIPRDENGDPREDLLKILNGNLEASVPDHPAGTAVELYGYSIPMYPNTAMQLGGATLPESLGVFAVTRVANSSGLRPIQIVTQQFTVPIGDGIDDTWSGDLELGDPIASDQWPVNAASDEFAAAFPTGGGYALLVQRRMRWRLDTLNAGQLSTDAEMGGVEIVRYTSRAGAKLSGVTRAAAIPGLSIQADANDFFAEGVQRRFVLRWAPWAQVAGVSLNELPKYMCFVVPVSIPFAGTVNDRSTLVEWAQLRPANGNDDATEWVRFNRVVERWLVRADQPAFDRLRHALTQQDVLDTIGVPRGGRDLSDLITAELSPWLPPHDDGRRRIGYIERLELLHPVVYAARTALGFRGDPFTGTSSHAHASGTPVLPVHRLEFDWPAYGIGAPRAGRGDRVALVNGSARRDGNEPTVEWHTVNWAVRSYDWDQVNPDSTQARTRNSGLELKGDFPFQLVAFQGVVRNVYLGEGAPSRARENLEDSRFLDRMVKFPSGELPAIDADEAYFGDAVFGDLPSAKGLLDEVAMTARRVLPRPLDEQLGESAASFHLRPNVALTATGPMVNAKPKQWPSYGAAENLPETGGLLAIDGELLAYSDFDPSSGRVTIAKNGRGLLGTTARAHDEGAIVQFIDHVPCGILAEGLGERDDELPLQSAVGFPRAGGTVLIGTELAHYCWLRGGNTLGMPRWTDAESRESSGLFRGRYGTTKASLSSGSPVIAFPARYWDREHERSDDPELAYLQVSLEPGPVFFDGFGWRTEEENALVKVRCLVRVDERAPFDADPEQDPGLRVLEKGEIEGAAVPIRRHGERFEARFFHVYRPGAFDGTSFLAQDWKRAPTIEWFLATYEGETRILAERVTTR